MEDTKEEFVIPVSAPAIYYTTTDTKPLQAGVAKFENILSNTYKNGKGFLIINKALTEIPEQAFCNFATLKSITIPNEIENIKVMAFCRCNSIASVTIPHTVTSIAKDVYCVSAYKLSGINSMFTNNASNRKIYVPRASVDAYKAADGWKEYADAIEPYDF